MLDVVAELSDGRGQILIARRLDAHVDRLARRRTIFLCCDLHLDARDVLHPVADVLENLVRLDAVVPRQELQLELADRVRRRRRGTKTALIAGEGHHRILDAVDLQDLVFDLYQDVTLLDRREIADRHHVHGAEFGLRRREGNDTWRMGEGEDGNDDAEADEQRRQRPTEEMGEEAHVVAGEALHLLEVELVRIHYDVGGLLLVLVHMGAGDDAADDGHEDQS